MERKVPDLGNFDREIEKKSERDEVEVEKRETVREMMKNQEESVKKKQGREEGM